MNEELVLVFSCYEIVNSVSEMQSRVSGRYLTLEAAEEALKNFCDWYRPKGTGRIYEMCYYLGNNGEITIHKNLIFERW